jgi:putative flippase GtrA
MQHAMSDLPPPSGDPAPPIVAQFLRYAGAGAVGTALHYALLVALVQLAGVPAVAASTAGAIAGALVNYGLNPRFTFASGHAHARALPRFAAVAVAGIGVNAVTMAAVLALAPAHYLVAQVVATAVVLALGYVANRRWTF